MTINNAQKFLLKKGISDKMLKKDENGECLFVSDVLEMYVDETVTEIDSLLKKGCECGNDFFSDD